MSTPIETPTGQELFDLLPVVHRLRDGEHGQVLRALMEVLGEQVDVLSEEIAQLYDDQFIETGSTWAVPYLGDLVGYRVRHGQAPVVPSQRAEVANTIAYRRRKGTVTVVEQLARDVTGWPARAVEFFERLVATQYMNHVRPHAVATPDFRDHESLGWVTRLNGAFDDLAHTADVRRIAAAKPATSGRYNIPNVGVFLWRVEAVPIAGSPLVPLAADPLRLRFDPLGADTQLFAQPRVEDEIIHVATPVDMPLPLGVRYLGDHVATYYGPGRSIVLERQTGAAATPVPLIEMCVCDLSDDPSTGGWAHQPPVGEIAIDPGLGRVYLGAPLDAGTRLVASFSVGHAIPVGAGAARADTAAGVNPIIAVDHGQNLQPRLNAVASGGTVRITDSDRYEQAVTVTTVSGPVGKPDTVVQLVAGEGQQPLIVAPIALRLQMQPRTTVVLDGFTIAGGPVVLEETGDREPRTVVVRNCTLVPGVERTADGEPKRPERASLVLLDPWATVQIEQSIVGPIVAVAGSRVVVRDSAIDSSDQAAVAVCGRAPVAGGLRTVTGVADLAVGDGTEPAGEVDLHECTVIGGIHCTQLDASNTLLIAELATGDPRPVAVHARRRQVGCVRYSYLPEESRVGKRYRCAPHPDDPLAVRAATRPRLTSRRFGDPAYLQLSTATPDSIRTGADDESEMGVSHLLFTPQREANLALRLDEYLRFGLEAGFCYAT
ncbi:hypothetical protein [Mycolicibacterium psychrotolerans]|uniref:Uncharacterized protein n=1 Tax=Mycolicibacterium psychrotolerans TaxID=216929 RepID=A0A7I7MCD7_9MYCO|nr:hypothetical protein [Mycolicibacterium psychrotolerans]BBX69961.1 hypothetical protein MPSYJ_34220 [Mycolicibacterium psychrotolerans]